ncbi:hypothetical protein ECE50_014070 [Chitinophaga sp. Mgbs1]|uniref:Uncharacterized protein n=1 Tax=Chitinophaga solisilvae TaxID=1233460 RepID=A0A433W920_9BACT|nr:hypothetical protein [Chitinophaga solisilvae]
MNKTLVYRLTGCMMLFLFLFSWKTQAQLRITTVQVSAEYVPSSRYIRPEDSVKTHHTTTQQRINTALGFSLYNRIDTATGAVRSLTGIISGSYSRWQHKDYERAVFPEELFAGDLGLSYYRTLRNRWAFLGMASAGIYSDMKEIDGNDIFINAGGAFIKQFRPNFALGFGLFVNTSFGNPMVWPTLLVQWKMGGRYKLNINVPDKGPGLAFNVGVTRIFSKQYELSLAFKPRQMTYDITRLTDDKRLMSYWELPIGIENRWHLKNIDLFIGGGIMPLRSAEFEEKKVSKMFSRRPGHKLATNGYFNIGFQWKL